MLLRLLDCLFSLKTIMGLLNFHAYSACRNTTCYYYSPSSKRWAIRRGGGLSLLFNLLEISPEQGRVDLTYFSVHTRISGDAGWEEEEEEESNYTTGVKKDREERGVVQALLAVCERGSHSRHGFSHPDEYHSISNASS